MVLYFSNASAESALVVLRDASAVPALSWSIPSSVQVPCSVPDSTWDFRVVTPTRTNVFVLTGVVDGSDLVLVDMASGALGVQGIARTRFTMAGESSATLKVTYGGVFLLVGLLIARCYQSSGRR